LIVLDGLDESPFKNEKGAHDIVSVAIAIGARVLVTSRTKVPELLCEYFVNLNLPAFSRRDSVAALGQLGIPEKDGPQVAEALGDHPLALYLFSNLVATYGSRGAMEELNKTSRRLKAGTSPMEFPIEDALQMSFKSLSKRARELLLGLARIPEGRISNHEGLPSDLKLLADNETLQDLVEGGFVQVDRLDSPSRIMLHSLIRAWLKNQVQVEP